MGLVYESCISLANFLNKFLRNKKFRIMLGPAKGLIWINDIKPNFTYNLGIWEPYKQYAMTKYIKKGMVVYDAGAFHGYFTMVCSRLVGEEGFVYAFEPVVENFEFLKNVVITLNKLTNVELCQKAVGGRNGEATCNFNSAEPMGGSIDVSKMYQIKPASEGYKVEITTLDYFAFSNSKREPDVVKLDIEAYEFDALQGMEKLINQYHPMFFIDAHNEENHRRCISFLQEHGYKVKIFSQKAFRKGGFMSDLFAIYGEK